MLMEEQTAFQPVKEMPIREATDPTTA